MGHTTDTDLQETIHLLRSPANAERLLRSIQSAEAGRVVEQDLVHPTARTKAGRSTP